jgi:hypothetical protein
MKPSVRPLEPRDFDKCWAISKLREKFSGEEARLLRAAWAYLLPRDEMFAAVVEDVSREDRPRIVAFGGHVFVTDEWMRKLRSSPKPLETTRVLLEVGKPHSNILNRRQIGLYNAQGGLNMVCAHCAEFLFGGDGKERRTWEDVFAGKFEEAWAIVERVIWAFQDVNRGFHVREMLAEGYGPFELRWALSGGNWKLRNDYVEYYSRSAEPIPSEDEHPYLCGATKEEITINSGLWSMFQVSRPVLGFSEGQKRAFLQAVRGYSNASIAVRLGLSEESVRNCFRAGYDKLRRHPVLGAEWEDGALSGTDAALLRKRNSFIEILRRHMEELRPWSTKPVLERNAATVFGPPPARPATVA